MTDSLAVRSDSEEGLAASGLWRLENVSVAERLVDMTVTVHAGATAILGPSGSGKSTLIDLLCGQLEPTNGDMTRPGPAAGSADRYSKVTMLWAGCGEGLWPQMSVKEQILAVGADPRDWLPRFDLETRKHMKPGVLSQGERSRCELARALAAKPTVLLLDEPLTHVDRRRATIGWDAIAEWAGLEGRSLVVATHDLSAAKRVTQSVICLDGGRVIDSGPWQRVQESPRSEESRWIAGGGE